MKAPNTLYARLRTSVLALVLGMSTGPLLHASEVCDVDGNGAVDIRDIQLVFNAIGSAASGPDDPRDAVRDGVITINDARACVYRCSLDKCAVVDTGNHPPTANAGADQTAFVGETVTLNGSGSTDPDGDSLTFSWSFLSRPAGSAATLSDPGAVMPTFSVDVPGGYGLQLVVNDGTADSLPDTVLVTTENSAPVANAGPDRTVPVAQSVTLDGSGSSDVDGDPLTYAWTLTSIPTGSGVTLVGASSVHPSLVPDVFGTYVAQLVVNDGSLDSAPDVVQITTENSPPIAHAGSDQFAFVGDTVTLDGSGSTDVDGDSLTYAWSFVSKPAASTTTLANPTGVAPTFDTDEPGVYVVQLIVNDGTVDSAPDTVTITTENSAPVADAGPDQTAFVGQTVVLDGSGSQDADGDPLTFQWSLTMVPPGSAAVLSDSTALGPTFDVDVPGTYVGPAHRKRRNGELRAGYGRVTTENSAPTADAGPNQNVSVGDTVTLDGNGSSDVDGNALTYSWSLTAIPTGSAATLLDATSANPTFVADVAGTYVIQLIVNDGFVDSAPDTVVISTENSAPVANAGPDQSVFVGATVTLDGTGLLRRRRQSAHLRLVLRLQTRWKHRHSLRRHQRPPHVHRGCVGVV